MASFGIPNAGIKPLMTLDLNTCIFSRALFSIQSRGPNSQRARAVEMTECAPQLAPNDVANPSPVTRELQR